MMIIILMMQYSFTVVQIIFFHFKIVKYILSVKALVNCCVYLIMTEKKKTMQFWIYQGYINTW